MNVKEMTDQDIASLILDLQQEQKRRNGLESAEKILAIEKDDSYEEFIGTFGEFLEKLAERLKIQEQHLSEDSSPYIKEVDAVYDRHDRFNELKASSFRGHEVTWDPFCGEWSDSGDKLETWRIPKEKK